MELSLVFPHQLFAPHPALTPGRRVLLLEDPLLFGTDSHWPLRLHAQKLVLHRASMTHWMHERRAEGFEVVRGEASGEPASTVAMLDALVPGSITTLHFCDPVDDLLSRRLRRFAAQRELKLIAHDTPMFLTPPGFIEQHLGGGKRPFMATFYQAQRRRLGILVEAGGKPAGGRWSFDDANRQRLPKGHRAPGPPVFENTPALDEAKHYIATKFPNARGSTDAFRWPVTRAQALRELDAFLTERLALFGHYEDAISHGQPWLYHSLLAAPLNIGLITPQEVVDRTLDHARTHDVPLNSLEGFVRQIIGWREFMRGIYHLHGTRVRNGNFFAHSGPLPEGFDDGTTGLPPIDAVMHRLHRHAWCHHIERLMVLGNAMVLMRIDPHAAYRWFMEWFIDAYDWVMVPNVYGMSLHADGGTFTTKPYISGSNYLLKMSDHPKGMWCKTWDDLFWRFIGDHRAFFARNPRMSMLVNQWAKRQKQ